jgi:hypothetical protein
MGRAPEPKVLVQNVNDNHCDDEQRSFHDLLVDTIVSLRWRDQLAADTSLVERTRILTWAKFAIFCENAQRFAGQLWVKSVFSFATAQYVARDCLSLRSTFGSVVLSSKRRIIPPRCYYPALGG